MEWQNHNIFPTAIGHFKFDREMTESEISFVKDQKTYFNQFNLTSIDTYILRQKELAEISSFCQAALQEYLEKIYAPKNKVALQITQSWANYTSKNQFHHKHNHPNSFVSGVFYFDCDENDSIDFSKSQYEQIKIYTKESTPLNCDTVSFRVLTGDLFLFPSSLDHMVPPVTSDRTRISIAFNSFPVGDIGYDNGLRGLRVAALESGA